MFGLGLLMPMVNQRGSGPSFTPEALALFAAMTTPPTGARKIIINNMIVSLQAAGVWSLIDILWVTAAADSQAARLNWKNPGTFTLSLTNSPTFVADRGFTGDGVSSGLTGPNLATFGGNYALNNASMGIWIGTDVTENVSDFGNPQALIRTHNGATTFSTRLNDATTTNNSSIATAVGFTSTSRAASGSYTPYKNGVAFADVSVVSTSVQSQAITMCFVGATFATKRAQSGYVGVAMTPTQMASLYSAESTYMTAVGA